MPDLNFNKKRGKLFCMFKKFPNKHARGYTHSIKLGLADKRIVFCLRPADIVELRDEILKEYPLDTYPEGSRNV